MVKRKRFDNLTFPRVLQEADADADRPLTRRELKDRATRVVNRKQG
jgi:hypothetical protein